MLVFNAAIKIQSKKFLISTKIWELEIFCAIPYSHQQLKYDSDDFQISIIHQFKVMAFYITGLKSQMEEQVFQLYFFDIALL